jgi:hypothetical protein
MPDIDDVANVLNDAADHLCFGGWVQGQHYRGTASCAVGALDRATPRSRLVMQAEETLKRYLGVRSIMSWNDSPDRTADEVVNAMRHAAKELRDGNISVAWGS